MYPYGSLGSGLRLVEFCLKCLAFACRSARSDGITVLNPPKVKREKITFKYFIPQDQRRLFDHQYLITNCVGLYLVYHDTVLSNNICDVMTLG